MPAPFYQFLKSTVLLTCLCSQWVSASPQSVEHQAHSRVGYHGMVVFTDGYSLYASHLPLYHAPHDYQIIYRLTFDDDETELSLTQYLDKNKRSDGQAVLTLLPEQFDLNRLVSREVLSLQTQFFKGHFERGGELWRLKAQDSVAVAYAEPLLVEPLRVHAAGEAADAPVDEASQNTAWYHTTLNPLSESLTNTQKHTDMFVHRIHIKPSFDAIVLAERCEQPVASVGDTLSLEAVWNAFSHCDNVRIVYADEQDFL
ncbi:hypothetical protein [Alteromonas oceanisediminis]|uniref:hypothetical protein n=1 Tax=Alteromonas oceanisediminis TaxID=2836180 RepID=UPI001BD963F0|nr:hypothetical protein [Alteromonas oceanisediminis]MBT0587381.1 hypothetical protein [Alteromonas oceanisediminis]